ncbi:N2N2-dimethylguanosine tRNA methyltransferase TRM1 [Methanonatronarchaeum thermophilum]|uniref:tRNA (guanine(26)-N(2))-dimethyltransferase n=1 Tax=Methanonatronarchaeum thermophilum TaxID=1927129 RepID=A0A1Y3GBL0_9EURY|nr:tRNA (guanine(10)-N(2))-dimethyltransferase [Methanonatronarchaeum thermophilum]OUJ18647.1 N2N2-dimethylguanosine tRNA methyltransferase TRM1 [Methanonatronarchaeum thermophilum]
MVQDFHVVCEGGVEFFVPSVEGDVDSSMDVFYNPVMESNRDISIAFIEAVSGVGDRYLDCHGATGVRGLRMADRVGELDVMVNDWSRDAAGLIERNRDYNSLDVEVCSVDANVLMSKRRFDIIDIDPFGSPVPFLDSAVRSLTPGGVLCMTATDTAPLSGAHKKPGIRRYSAIPLNTPYHKELGARILVGKTALISAQYDIAINSIFTYYKDHYFRSYLSTDKGAKKANKTMEKIGFLHHCFNCGSREMVLGLDSPGELSEKCSCGHPMSFCGPLYLGELMDSKVLSQVLENLNKDVYGTKKNSMKLVETCISEAGFPPTYYDIHNLCKMESIRAPKTQEVLVGLRERGFIATKTHFNLLGIKTDADVSNIKEVLNELA